MKKALYLFLLSVSTLFYAQSYVSAQSVSCPYINFSAGHLLNLPCGQGTQCTTLTATLPDIRTTSSYTVDSMPYTNHLPFTISGATVVSVPYDDHYSPLITLPFNFCFYGISYSSVAIGANGIITFNSAYAGGNCAYTMVAIPYNGYASPPILGCFEDINPGVGGTIEYSLIGSAPCRQLVVNYRDVPNYGCNSLLNTFQFILYENTNVIEVYIKDKPICTTWQAGAATIGLQNATATAAVTVPGKNATTWGSAGCNLAYRFVPSGTSLLNGQVQLITGGSVAQSVTPVLTSPGLLTATFPNICVALNDSATYVVKAAYTPCSGTTLNATDTILIRNKTTTAAPTATSPVTVCKNSTPVQLTATGTGLLWYTAATGGIGSNVAPSPPTATVGTTTYYVSQTIAGCESPRTPITVNVIALPVVTVTPTTANPCANTSTILSASGASTYSWSPATGLNTTTGGTVVASPASTITYTVIGTAAGASACTNTASATITVKPTPVISSAIGTNPTTCIPQNGSITLNGLTAGNTYNYSSSFNGGAPVTGTLVANSSGQVVINGLSAGTYSGITVTLNGCSSALAGPVTLNAAALPAAPVASSSSPVCVGGSINLAASTVAGASYNWTGPLGYTSNAQSPVLSNAATNMSGTYSVTATVGGCVSAAGSTTVVVNPVPAAPSVSTPVIYCVNASNVTPLSATGSNLLWYMTATGGTGNPVAPTPSVAVAGNTTYYVSQTTSNCESPRAAILVTVNPLPVITVSPAAPAFCAGGSTTMTASGANSYTWSPALGLNTTSGATVTANPTASTVYTVTGTDGNNCSASTTVSVTVKPLPVVTASSNSPVCAGHPINLSGASATATSFSWTGPAGYISASQNPIISNASAANAGTYSVTGTLNGCPGAASSTNVVVNPVLSGAASAQICPGGSVSFGGTTISAAGTYVHTFTSAAGCDSVVTLTVTSFSSITTSFSVSICSGTSYTFNGIAHSASGAYSAIFTAQTGCDSISTLNLTVNPIPAAPTAVSPVTYCQFSTPVPLTATGSNLTWYTTPTGGIGNTTAPTPSANVPGSTTWYVSQTVLGCESARTPITVNVTAQPTAPTVVSPVNICVGSNPAALTASGSNLLWYTAATGGTGNPSAPVPSATATGSTTYYVSQTVSGCESPRSAITVIINPLPVITVTPVTTTICAGQSVGLSAAGASTYTWAPAAGLNTAIGASVTATPAATITYTVTGTTAAPALCSSTATATITVNPVPVITASSNSPVCTGGTLNLFASAITGVSYAWSGPGSFSATSQNPSITSAAAANAGTYSVTATLNNCTSTAATTSVVINPLITHTSAAQLCPGASIVWGGITINAAGAYTHTFTTSGGCDSFATLNVTLNTPIATSFSATICGGQSYAFAGNTYTTAGNYSATYTAQNGCDSIRTLNLTVNPLPAAPTVISPVTYCQFSTSTALSATGSNLLWYTTATGGIGNSTAPIPSTNVAGSITRYVSQTVNGCEGPRAPITVNVTAQPAAPTVATPVIYCEGAASGPLTATGSNLLWYNSATGGTGNTAAPTPSTASAGSYTFYVSQTVNGCESPRAAIVVTVNPVPVLTVTPSGATVCAGQSVVLTAGGASTYAWSPATGLNFTNTAQVTATPTVTSTYTITGTNAFNCTSTAAVTVIVNPLLIVTASSNSPVCAGQTLNLTASNIAGASYSWTGPNSFTSNLQNPSIANVSTSAAGLYSVIATLNSCTSLPVSTNVIVNPTKTGTASAQLCNGSTYTFGGQTISSAGTYTHVFSTTLGCDSTVTLTVTISTAITTSFNAAICAGQSYTYSGTAYTTSGAYTVHFTAQNGCDSASTLNLTVNPLPAAPTVISPVNYCVGENPSPLTATGSNLKWYTTATGGIGNTIAPTPSTATAGSTSWYVSQTTNGCEGPRAAITVNVNALPVVTVTPASSTICNGQSVTLTAGGATTYSWTPAASLNLSNVAAVTATPTATTTYTVTGTTNGCISMATATVTVNPVPVVTASSNTPVCSGNALNLTANAPAGSSYSWTGPGGFNSASQNPVITNAAITASGTYSVTATLNGCASLPVTTAVVVNQTPAITVSGTSPTACGLTDGIITISGLTANAAYTIGYSLNGTPIIPTAMTANSSGNIVISSQGAGTYTVFTATQNGCTSAPVGPLTLISPSSPVTPTATSNSPLCAGATLNLSATTSTTGVTYAWTGPNGFTSSQQSPSLTNVTTAMAGIYNVTATKAGCTSAAGTVNVVINPIPATPVAGSNSPVCSGNTLNLTAGINSGASYAWSGPNGFSSAQQNPAINNVTAAAAGVYTVTATLAGCASAAGNTTVVINPTPMISGVTTTAQTNCATPNGTLTVSGLAANGTYTLAYTFGGIITSNTYTANSSGNIVLTGLANGSYSNIIATQNGCGSASAGPATIAAPGGVIAPTAAANTPCAGATLSLIASSVAGATYSWSGPNGFTSTQQNPSINNATTAASGTYSVTVTVNGCTSPAGTVLATVLPIPAVPVITAASPICEGGTLSLNAASSTAGASFSWTGPNGFSSSSQSPVITNVTAAASGVYSATATVNGCTSAAGTASIMVNPLPAAPGVTNISYCQNEPPTLLTATGTNLQWYTSQTGGTPLNGAPLPSTSIAATYTWYVSQTTNGCEGPRAAIIVTVKPKPAVPAAIATTTYCQNDVAGALSATGTSLLWYTTATGGTGNINPPTPATTTPGTFIFYVSQTVNGCESDRAALTVIVNAKPAPPTVSALINYCQGDAAAPLSAIGANLKWYATATGGTGVGTAPLPNTAIAGSTFYFVSQTVGSCESDRAQIRVSVHEKPNGIIIASHSLLCQTDTLNFYYYGSAPAGAVYNWSFPAGSVLLSGSGQGPMTVAFNNAGNFTVSLQVDDSGCTSPLATYDVTVRSRPALHMVLNRNACVDEKVTIALNQATPGVHGYQWNFDGAQVLSSMPDGGPFVVEWHQPGTYHPTVSATNGECPSLPDTGTITVHELPVASILDKSAYGEICATDTIALYAQQGVGYEYHWSPEPFFDINNMAWVAARVQYSGYIHLNVQTTWGCRSADSVLVQTHPCCTVSLPSAFSPNGDGRNDLFRMISPAVQRISTFRIVNRWGQVVWETLRPDAGWDGTYMGVQQGSGVYYYYLKYQCADGNYYEQKGEFTLLR